MIIPIPKAIQILNSQGVVAIPTETVYGLAGDATSDMAVARIFETKGRPQFNPLIVHVWNRGQIEEFGILNEAAKKLADAFWPGPLTLVIKLTWDSPLSKLASAGLPTIAVRMPGHPVAFELLKTYGKPLAAPSANKSGHISPTTSDHVTASLGEGVPILEGGKSTVGLESTILDVSTDTPHLLRHGAILVEDIESVLGAAVLDKTVPEDGKILSPGQMLSHYAPRLPLRINVTEPRGEEEAYLGFGPTPGATLNLSPTGDLVEAAANLFSMLYQLDNPQYQGISVAPIPNQGLGCAINDRLQRAAQPKGH